MIPEGINFVTGQMNAEQQYVRQRGLMGIQMVNQKELNEQAQRLSMKTWEETNYPAQVKMLKEAGLNPGLMYAKGGVGGTTQTGSGGSASMGTVQQAPMAQLPNLLAMEAQKEQIELIKAEKNRADAERKEIEARTPTYGASIDKTYAEIANLIAQTGNTNAQRALTEANTAWQNIQNDYAGQTLDENVKAVIYNNIKLMNDIREGDARANVAVATTETTIAQIKANAIKQAMEIGLLKEGIAKTKEEAKEIVSRTSMIDTEKIQSWQKLDQKERELELTKWQREIEEEWKEFGTSAVAVTGQIFGAFGNLLQGVKPMMTPGTGTAVKGFGR